MIVAEILDLSRSQKSTRLQTSEIRRSIVTKKKQPCHMLGLTFGKHLHDRITSVTGDASFHTTSLRSPIIVNLPVPRQDSERSCICV
jgi:hypothetical protein